MRRCTKLAMLEVLRRVGALCYLCLDAQGTQNYVWRPTNYVRGPEQHKTMFGGATTMLTMF